MTTIKDLRKAADKLGALVEYDTQFGCREIRVEAPHGHVWSGSGLHEMVDCCYKPWHPDYDDMLARMAYGVEPCTDPTCDWCHPE